VVAINNNYQVCEILNVFWYAYRRKLVNPCLQKKEITAGAERRLKDGAWL